MRVSRTYPIPKPSSALRDLRAVAFSPDGATLWALAERKLLQSVRGRSQPSWHAVFKGAALLATSTAGLAIAGDRSVGLLDLDSGEVRSLRRPPGGSKIENLRWAPDGSLLGAFSRGMVDVFNADGAHVCRVANAFLVSACTSLGPGPQLLTLADGQLVSFDARSGEQRFRAAVSPLEGSVPLDRAMGGSTPALVASTRDVFAVHYEGRRRRTGKRLSGTEARLCVVKANGAVSADFPTGTTNYAQIAVSPTGDRLVAAGYDLFVHVYDSKGTPLTKVRRSASNPPVALALAQGVLADAQLNISVLRAT
jgi:hypothetical protein